MPIGRFTHIYISPKQGVSKAQVEEQINNALDWYRYDDKNYVVYTTSEVHVWLKRMQALAEPDGRLLISELNPNAKPNGWMNLDFWDWIKKAR